MGDFRYDNPRFNGDAWGGAGWDADKEKFRSRPLLSDSTLTVFHSTTRYEMPDYSYENPEVSDDDEWETKVIWDAEELRNKCPQPEIPMFSTTPQILDYGYENSDVNEVEWESKVIWDAEDFRNRCPIPQPRRNFLHANDGTMTIVLDLLSNETTELESDPQQANAITKKSSIQPHTLKSKQILDKTGVIPWKGKQVSEEADKTQMKADNAQEANKFNIKLSKTWNISNDEFYEMKESKVEVYHCRHSKVVKELTPPFITTHLSEEELRNFHRPKLTVVGLTAPGEKLGRNGHCFKQLAKRIYLKAKARIEMMEKGLELVLDSPIDLSARDGAIILVEYSEEHPPLLSQVGMCSQIVNFYREDNKSLKNKVRHDAVSHGFGERVYFSNASSSTFPFLGSLEKNQGLSAIGNNMYHSPIYWHGKSETDFLIIQGKQTGMMIREMDGQFVAGQQCPLIEVPEPNSTKVKNFLKDYLQVFVYRTYARMIEENQREHEKEVKEAEGIVKKGSVTNDTPKTKMHPKIRMDVIIKHFPTLTENSIRAYLKTSSDLIKSKTATWVEMKRGLTLPDESELRKMVTPEQVCAYYSLLAAEQRFKDLGFDSMLALSEDRGQDELENKKGRKSLGLVNASSSGGNKLPSQQKQQQQQVQSAFEEELLSAPWNTTSAFIAAKKGRCFLQVTGPADPTGCGEAHSYVRVAKRTIGGQVPPGETQPHQAGRGRPRKYPPKTGGTDADLRKLSAKTAKALLRDVGVPEKEVQKLTRWQIIDLVRTLSTEKAMQGETTDKGIAKFCRWKSIHSATMNQERYKEACQRVFDLQNKVLSSREQLSSDECESDEEDGNDPLNNLCGESQKEIEQMGRNLEKMLTDDNDVERMTHEEEELERLDLQIMMLGDIRKEDAEIAKRKEALEREKAIAQKTKESNEDFLKGILKNPNNVLKITRTFEQEDKSTYTRTEIVRNPMIMAAYMRIRNSKSEAFIKQFLDKADRREKKEKKQKDRLLLGQLHDVAKVEEQKVLKQQVKRKREIEDEYFPNKESKKNAEKALKRQSRKCGACSLPGHNRTSQKCPMFSQEKFDQMVKKREEKKLKKQKVAPIQIQLVQPEGQTKESTPISDTDTDSGSTSSDDFDLSLSPDEFEDETELNRSQSSMALESSQEEPLVKTDGLKMFVNKKSVQEYLNQAQEEQEAKEQEVRKVIFKCPVLHELCINQRNIKL